MATLPRKTALKRVGAYKSSFPCMIEESLQQDQQYAQQAETHMEETERVGT